MSATASTSRPRWYDLCRLIPPAIALPQVGVHRGDRIAMLGRLPQ